MTNTLAFIGGLGGPEIAVIFIIVLLLFGAKKIPELARGLGKSMGEFKRARNDFEDEIKMAEMEVSKDEEIVARFRQEAQSATSIGNEHIIDISDFGVLPDGSTYFVMEFLDGIALTDAIQPGQPIEAQRTIHIAHQL